VTQLLCGRIFNNHFIANRLQNASAKNFENRLIFGKDIDNHIVGHFLGTQCMCLENVNSLENARKTTAS